jgi:hypothetical protein
MANFFTFLVLVRSIFIKSFLFDGLLVRSKAFAKLDQV